MVTAYREKLKTWRGLQPPWAPHSLFYTFGLSQHEAIAESSRLCHAKFVSVSIASWPV